MAGDIQDNEQKGTAEIDIRDDGVYLIVRNPPIGKKVSRKDVLALIESFAIKDIDFAIINEVFTQTSSEVIRKISNNTQVQQADEKLTVELSKDRMSAKASFVAAVARGKKLTIEGMREALNAAGVVFGIDEVMLFELSERRSYEESYIIAKGQKPTDSTDGQLIFHFSTQKMKPTPKVQNDGSVDFRDLGIVQQCKEGDLLVRGIDPVEGTDGTDVTGKILPCRKPKPTPNLPVGKNVVVSEDGKRVLAGTSGQIIFENNRVSVLPILEVTGNVDASTGDIDFMGSVTIKGNVSTGYKVKATQNIEVGGVVEGATLESYASIVVAGGIMGGDKANIKAQGDIAAKFIYNATAVSGGDITAGDILHSHIQCGGLLKIDGRKGQLVGGTAVVNERIEAKTIGSSMSTATEIRVGNLPEDVDKNKEIVAELNAMKKEYEKVDTIVERLKQMQEKGELPEDKKNVLLKSIQTRMFYRGKINDIQVRMQQNMQAMDPRGGVIKVSDTMYYGVKVIIGDAMMHMRDVLHNVTMTNKDGHIHIGPY